MPGYAIPAIFVLVALFAAIVLFKMMWRVAEPSEALVISGLRKHTGEGKDDTRGTRFVTGSGTLVIPGVHKVRRLMLNLQSSDLEIECVTYQGIPVRVKGVVIFKIGGSEVMLTNAASRFLDHQDEMDQNVLNVFQGHLRSIIGGMTIEDMIRDRTALTNQVREASGAEMSNIGLIIDSLQIKEIDDPTGYIENLAAPHIASVKKAARIAEAESDQAASIAEAEANANKAEAERNSAVRRAGFEAETEQAKATASQAGPLAEAMAKRQVVAMETEIAGLEAERTAKELETTVTKPAEAEAAKVRTMAAANRDATIANAEAEAAQTEKVGAANATATRATGTAEADVIEAKGEAEGKAIKARSDALAENPDSVIQQMLAEKMPEIVAAFASPLSSIDTLTVLDGTSGVTNSIASGLTQIGALIPGVLEMFKSKGGSQDDSVKAPTRSISAGNDGEPAA